MTRKIYVVQQIMPSSIGIGGMNLEFVIEEL